MRDLARLFDTIKSTSGASAKATIVATNGKNYEFIKALRFLFNPYAKCGIGTTKLNKALLTTQNLEQYTLITPCELIDYLSSHTTGTDADCIYAAKFVHYWDIACCDSMVTQFAKDLVTQSVSIGVSTKTLNSIFGSSFIPTVGCMLGTLFADVKKVEWPCIVTEKLDGIRRVLIKENGVCRMFSRSGHEDFGCVDIINEAKYLPDNYVYDGELLAIGNFKDNIATRQATSSIANSKGIKHGLCLNVFDMVPVADFYEGISKMPAIKRKVRLGAIFANTDKKIFHGIDLLGTGYMQQCFAYQVGKELQFIKPVEVLALVNNLEEAMPYAEAIWERGGEGIMLNTVAGFYEIKRSKKLLKIKHTEEATLVVIDVEQGTGKYTNTMGSLVLDYKGQRLGVGSGFTDAQRDEIWAHKDKYIGKLVEIDTFGASTNAAGGTSLNCPIFKRFVGTEE